MQLRSGLMLLSVLCCGVVQARDVLDRIAVNVNNQAILESQVIRQVRLSAFQNKVPLAVNSETKREAAQRMVDQILIADEMHLSRITPVQPKEVDTLLAQIKATYGADYQPSLQRYAVSEPELRQFLSLAFSTLRFIDARFRPGVQISDTEIQEHYQNIFSLEWKAKTRDPLPPLTNVRGQIEQQLVEERVDHDLDRWLGGTRIQARIRFHEEAFQ